MAWWTQLLPFILVKWFARRYCERYSFVGDDHDYAWAYYDADETFIRINSK